MADETVTVGTGASVDPNPGTAGLHTQVAGSPATVSAAGAATGGPGAGHFIERDVDDQLFAIQSEDTALMSVMLKSKKVSVGAAEVDHYQIDEQRSTLTTETAVASGTSQKFVLPLVSEDQNIPREYHTLLVKGVDGYSEDGQSTTPGKLLMLYVTGQDATSGNPVVRAINGPKATAKDMYCTTPAIPAGTKVVLLANAMYETQKEVEPSLIVPQPTTVYLQKRGMNQIVSDYFDSQKKRIPFDKAIIAEQAILAFKRESNRTLWAGIKGRFPVKVPKLGEQLVYCTEGIRWQFKREMQHNGKWTIEELIGLAKMFFTGEDVPKSALLLAGKNLLESLQCIDYSKHPEIQITQATNNLGWAVTRIHTVFGDIDIKREPTLDTLGWSNSGALLGDNRLVHYRRTTEHEFSDRVDGEEATRTGVIVWDALALKGYCHIWIDGEGEGSNKGSLVYTTWNEATAPTGEDLVSGRIYYLTVDCPGIAADAKSGEMWTYDGTNWSEYVGVISE